MKKESGRKIAQRTYRLTRCCVCGTREKLNRHHIDLNPINNCHKNVQILCASCHALMHQLSRTRRVVVSAQCVICGKHFQPKRSRRSKICSAECLSSLGKMSAEKRWCGRKTTKTCAYCGKEFNFTRARQTTCSLSCGNKLAWDRRNGKMNPP